MAASKIKPLALAVALFAFSGPASAQQMVRADAVAAGAIWAQKLSVTEMITYCEAYVAPIVKDQLAVVLENWTNVNRKYLIITNKIRLEMIKSVIRANGQDAAADFVASMEVKDEAAKAGVRADLDQNPADQRRAGVVSGHGHVDLAAFDVGLDVLDDGRIDELSSLEPDRPFDDDRQRKKRARRQRPHQHAAVGEQSHEIIHGMP